MPNLLIMRNKGILIFIFGCIFLLGMLYQGKSVNDMRVSQISPSYQELLQQNSSFSTSPPPISPNSADPKEPATLIINKSYGEVRINGSTRPNSLTYQYLDQFNQSIQGANISTNWTNGQWTWNYRNNEYELNFYAPSTQFVAGTKVYVSINFSSTFYDTCEHLLPMYILINTTIEQLLGKDMIYFNQSLDLQFAWYTSMGDRISSVENDPYRNITIKLDGEPIDSAWWTYDSSQTNSTMPNIFIRIYSDAFSGQNYLGFHQYNVICSEKEDSRWHETQYFSGIFEVIETPTYLSYQYSSAIFEDISMNPHSSPTHLYQFANNTIPLSITILYQYNATFLPIPDSVLPFNYGQIYGYLYDLTHNQRVSDYLLFTPRNTERIGNGQYYCLFKTQDLDLHNYYNIIIFANTTNFAAPPHLILDLSIIPQWNVIFDYSNPSTITEGQQIKLTGTVNFNNGTAQWPATLQRFTIHIDLFGKTQNASQDFYEETGSTGYYEFTEFIAPDWDLYDYVIVIIEFPESFRNKGTTIQFRIDIKRNFVSRFWLPMGIIAGILLFGTVFVLKVVIPGGKILMKRLGSTLLEHPFFGPLLRRIRRIDPHHLPVSPLDSLEILRVPPLNIPYTALIDDDKVEILRIETDITPKTSDFTRVTEFIGKTVKDLQHTLFRFELTPQELLAEKDTLIHNGTLFIQKGYAYSALINFFTAYQFAVSLQLKEEMTFLEQMIAELLDRLTPYEKSRYIRHVRAFYRRARIFSRE